MADQSETNSQVLKNEELDAVVGGAMGPASNQNVLVPSVQQFRVDPNGERVRAGGGIESNGQNAILLPDILPN